MSWKREFTTGVQHFRKGEYELALENFNQVRLHVWEVDGMN